MASSRHVHMDTRCKLIPSPQLTKLRANRMYRACSLFFLVDLLSLGDFFSLPLELGSLLLLFFVGVFGASLSLLAVAGAAEVLKGLAVAGAAEVLLGLAVPAFAGSGVLLVLAAAGAEEVLLGLAAADAVALLGLAVAGLVSFSSLSFCFLRLSPSISCTTSCKSSSLMRSTVWPRCRRAWTRLASSERGAGFGAWSQDHQFPAPQSPSNQPLEDQSREFQVAFFDQPPQSH